MFQRHNKEETEDHTKQLPQPALKYPVSSNFFL